MFRVLVKKTCWLLDVRFNHIAFVYVIVLIVRNIFRILLVNNYEVKISLYMYIVYTYKMDPPLIKTSSTTVNLNEIFLCIKSFLFFDLAKRS